MMIGASALRAASRHALTEEEVTQLTAGMAYPLALASSNRSTRAWPVTTPGCTDAGSFDVGVYLSLDDTISATDTLLSRLTTASLAAGANDTQTLTLTVNPVPGVSATTPFFIGVLVDDGSAIPESDETNNGNAANGGVALHVACASRKVVTPACKVAAPRGRAKAVRGPHGERQVRVRLLDDNLALLTRRRLAPVSVTPCH